MLKGIDISEWQGSQDFAALKRNFDFVIARSSFGTARADNNFPSNRDGLRGTGQLRGYYHYAYPNNNTPEAEAAFCSTVLGQLQAGEVFALDFEEAYNGDAVDWCLRFLQKFEQMTGYKPLIYIDLAMVQAHDWTPVIKNDNGLWLAEWDFNPDGNVPALPWSVCAMRQYTDKMQYNGQTIDADVFYGDEGVFKAYGFKASTTPNTGGADMYGGLDLNNKDSMKVCVDIFNKVQHGEYVDKAKYDTDLKAKDDTISVLNGTISQDNDTIKNQKVTIDGIPARLKVLQDEIDTLQPAADQLAETKKLLEQSEIDKENLIKVNKQLTNSNAQLKNTSYTTAPTGTLVGELLKRVTSKVTFQK